MVERFRTVEALPAPLLRLSVLVAKLQLAPVGSWLHESETLAPKTPCVGATTTLYCAAVPAATVCDEGAIATVNEVAENGAVTVLLVFVFVGFETVAIAWNVPGINGVTTNVTVTAEPACRAGIVQMIFVLLVAALQIPVVPPVPVVPLTAALLNITPVGTWPSRLIEVATSGPRLASV